MPRVQHFEVFAVELPFRQAFKHAAKERRTSESLLLKCTTDSGQTGFGESLPRDYVTGETRDGAMALLCEAVLPRLLGMEFASLEDVKEFLRRCDGKAPADWIRPAERQTAAWCAVDVALLDAFGRAFEEPVDLTRHRDVPPNVRYSPVISSDSGLKKLLKIRLFGCPQVKLKVESENVERAVRRTRRLLGRRCDIRADANMAWSVDEALVAMRSLARYGVRSFEQPIERDDVSGLARLVRESGAGIMVDESLGDRESLERLIHEKACTAVNVRISKCGGLIASFSRCRQALDAGLTVQIGCQVGETSLLSAAHLALVTAVREVMYAESCFGHLLLEEDPASPCLQFGYGGRPPARPRGPGFGVRMDERIIERFTVRRETVGQALRL